MSTPMKDKETKKKRGELKKKLYQMVDKFVEICALDSEYYLVEKNDYTSKIMEQQVRDMARSIEQDRIEQEAERRGYERGIKKIIAEYGENYNDGCGCCATKQLDEELVKLLEEDNGKQNAR